MRRKCCHAARLFLALAITAFLSACANLQVSGPPPSPERAAMYRAILAEPAGNYFIGRRYYKEKYATWGYIRKPRSPWHTAELVMINESLKLMPDKVRRNAGFDDNFEYRLYGRFTGDEVYEPASNSLYPEFMVTDYEILDENPPSIFANGHVNDKTDTTFLQPQVIDLQDLPAPVSVGLGSTVISGPAATGTTTPATSATF